MNRPVVWSTDALTDFNNQIAYIAAATRFRIGTCVTCSPNVGSRSTRQRSTVGSRSLGRRLPSGRSLDVAGAAWTGMSMKRTCGSAESGVTSGGPSITVANSLISGMICTLQVLGHRILRFINGQMMPA